MDDVTSPVRAEQSGAVRDPLLVANPLMSIERKARQIFIAEVGDDGRPITKLKLDVVLKPHKIRLNVHLSSEGDSKNASPAVLRHQSEIVKVKLDLPDGEGGYKEYTGEFPLEQYSYVLSATFETS